MPKDKRQKSYQKNTLDQYLDHSSSVPKVKEHNHTNDDTLQETRERFYHAALHKQLECGDADSEEESNNSAIMAPGSPPGIERQIFSPIFPHVDHVEAVETANFSLSVSHEIDILCAEESGENAKKCENCKKYKKKVRNE